MKKYICSLLFIFVTLVSQAAKVEDVTIPSKLMNKTFKCRVILPDSYDGKILLKQIYLLHGASGNYMGWTDKTSAKQLADKYNRIIICPTAGPYSWYNNHNKSEDYIITEVIPFIDAKYKTVNDRWLTGLSMGGYGAIRLGYKYPKVFSAWGGQSSGVKPSDWKKSWYMEKAFGRIPTMEDDLFSDEMVEKMKTDKRPFTMLCGKQDFFFKNNEAALKKCRDAGVKVFHQPTVGGHNWDYWKKSLLIQLAFFAKSEIDTAKRYHEQQKIDVYILTGQSNMQGIGKLKNLPSDYKNPRKNTFFWNGKAFEKLVPGKTKSSARKGEFGPEIGFSYMMEKSHPDRKIYIIKHYASGQPLHHGWNGNKWLGGEPAPNRRNFYPGKKVNDTNMGSNYKKLKSVFSAALKNLNDAKIPYTIRGLVWMQGEQDTKNKVSAKAYAQSLKLFKKRLEEDLDTTTLLPLVFGQVCPHTPALKRFIYRTELRQSMANAHWKSGHKDSIPGVCMISTNGMPLLKDTVHYNALGQIMLGKSMAIAMLQMQQELKKTAKKQ